MALNWLSGLTVLKVQVKTQSGKKKGARYYKKIIFFDWKKSSVQLGCVIDRSFCWGPTMVCDPEELWHLFICLLSKPDEKSKIRLSFVPLEVWRIKLEEWLSCSWELSQQAHNVVCQHTKSTRWMEGADRNTVLQSWTLKAIFTTGSCVRRASVWRSALK